MSATPWRRPESVLVVVYTENGECLLLERSEPRGYWQSVTGTLGWDETPEQAAVRELAEETGLAAPGLVDAKITHRFPIHPAWRARYAPDIAENLEHLWYLRLPAPVPVRLNPAEHVASAWLPLEAATARASSWTNREAIERLR